MPPTAQAATLKVFIKFTFKTVQHVDNVHKASGFER